MHKRWTICVALLSLACASGPATVKPSQEHALARAHFERLKSLAGTWVTVQEEGTQPAGQKVRYEVTSRGTALVETLFAGTVSEMLSVYSIEDGELVLKHYCSLGNQPRMRAIAGPVDGKLAFEFDGGANLDPARDTHMHQAEFEWVDEAHVRASWTVYERGRPADAVRLALVRTWN